MAALSPWIATATQVSSELMKLTWLLVFVPIGVGLDWLGASPMLVFLTSALAIIPLAGLMGDATEALAEYLGRPSAAC